MKFYSQEDICNRISVAGNAAYPGYIIKGSKKNLMVDAGVNMMGPLYLQCIENILGSTTDLDYLFVTHSHYDHLGSVPYLKRKIPDLILGGYPTINDLLKKESVLKTMRRLSEMQREIFKEIVGDEDVSIEPVNFDLELREGDEISLGDLTVQVYETPGHTRDSLSFYLPEIGALFPGEAIGVADWRKGEYAHSEFLTSYDDYVSSIEKLMSLEPKLIGTAHGWVFTDSDATEFIKKSHRAASDNRDMIERYLEEACWDREKTVELITLKEYDEKGDNFQERNAFIANLKAKVNCIYSMRQDYRI